MMILQLMGRPGGEPIDPALHRLPMHMPADDLVELAQHLFGFLQEKEIRLFRLDEGGDIAKLRAAAMPKIPADHFQRPHHALPSLVLARLIVAIDDVSLVNAAAR